ncbi:MAG: hypothetical protein L3K10_03450 [Thermoplasmata archaeon]|nr:hypothetical protein [Thermoplasmata archaeon]
MSKEFAQGPDQRTPPSPDELFARFRKLYDASAADMTTELGLFFERHYKFVQYEQLLDTNRPEYLDQEWNRVFAGFIASLAREFGFVPGRQWTGVPGMIWFWPSSPTEVGVLFQEVNEANDSILTREVPQMVRDGAPVSVLIMYPDYPLAPGTSDVAQSTDRWRKKVGHALSGLGPSGDFLLMTISAVSWELPSTWAGFVWDPTAAELRPVGSP